MKLIKSKKGISFLLVIAIAAISAVGAFAYWTTTGAGSGTAENADSNGTLVLHATWAADALYPGGNEDVSFTADNTTGTSNLYVGTIHLESVSSDDLGCDVADFSMDDVVSNTIVPAGATGTALAGTGSIEFANTLVNKDDCKGAAITLTLSSN